MRSGGPGFLVRPGCLIKSTFQQRTFLFQFRKESLQIERARLFFGLAAGEGEIAFQHRLHILDVLLHRIGIDLVTDEGELEFKSGQDSAQIVADTAEHSRALLNLPFNALAHDDKCCTSTANLFGTTRLEVGWRRPPLAETVGGASPVAGSA